MLTLFGRDNFDCGKSSTGSKVLCKPQMPPSSRGLLALEIVVTW